MLSISSFPRAYRYALDIKSIREGEFTEVNGISSEVELETIREGGKNDCVIQLPTIMRFPFLVLKRGLVNRDLLDWYLEYRNKGILRKENITIRMLSGSNSGEDILQEWYFEKAYPVKWTGPALNAMSSSVAFETIEFVHGGIFTNK